MSRRSNGAGNAVQSAQAALQEIGAQIGALVASRREALLHGSDEAVQKIDAELEQAQRLQKTRADRLAVLGEEAEKQEAARRVREKSDLIERVEKKIAARSAAVEKLAACVAAADAALLEVFAHNRAILAAWPWGNGDRGAVMLGDPAVLGALSNEIFRVAGRPASTGGMPGNPKGPSYPGGRPERLEWIALPEKSSEPMIAKFEAASRAAIAIMKTGRNHAPTEINGAVASRQPAPADAGSNDAPGAPASGLVAGQINAPIPDSDEGRAVLRKLLQRQAELAEQDGEEAEAAYRAVGQQIAAMS
jgi:hypothetical protein